MTQLQTLPEERYPANPFVRTARPHGVSRWIPGLAALRTYQRPWLAKDLMAGLVLTAIYGLYATIIPLLAYAIFGPSRILVLGPDSSLAAIIAATIVPLAAGDANRLVALAACSPSSPAACACSANPVPALHDAVRSGAGTRAPAGEHVPPR